MLPKKKLAKAEQDGDETIIRGQQAKSSFSSVLGMHFDSKNPLRGKISDDDDSEEDESRMTGRNQQSAHLDSVSPHGPSKRARTEQDPSQRAEESGGGRMDPDNPHRSITPNFSKPPMIHVGALDVNHPGHEGRPERPTAFGHDANMNERDGMKSDH